MNYVTYGSLDLSTMTREYVSDCVRLWVTQFKEAREKLPDLPASWGADTVHLRSYLEQHVDKGQAIVAESHGRLVGYMAYDRSVFHGEETAFSPVLGHASVPGGRSTVYRAMYRYLSGVWVADRALNHIVICYTCDERLIEAMFHLGFGVYVVDCFKDTSRFSIQESVVAVREATVFDLDELTRLGEESRRFYREPPVFLVRNQEPRSYYESLLNREDGNVFVTEVEGKLAGFLYVSINDAADHYSLAARGVGLIDEIGAYVEPSSRGYGAGSALLGTAVDWCREKGVEVIHVDFESANLFASGFWPKYFTPSLYSLRRRVNMDIMS